MPQIGRLPVQIQIVAPGYELSLKLGGTEEFWSGIFLGLWLFFRGGGGGGGGGVYLLVEPVCPKVDLELFGSYKLSHEQLTF